MKQILLLLIISIFITFSKTKSLTLYEYYTNGGIISGLRAEGDNFELNGRPITILSGSFHYFRVHQSYWRSILKKFKAAGLNAVNLIFN